MGTWFRALALSTVVVAWMGCAKAKLQAGDGSEAAGAGGGGGGFGGDTSSSSRSSTSSHAASSSTAGAGGQASSSSGTSSSGSSSSGSGGGGNCGAMQHDCGGVCVGNTPDKGCYADATCTPCAAPVNGVADCSANGQCDFTCDAGYNKMGASCACAAACCVDADCPGGKCQGGTCVMVVKCDPATCVALCFIKMKLGVCVGTMCTCI